MDNLRPSNFVQILTIFNLEAQLNKNSFWKIYLSFLNFCLASYVFVRMQWWLKQFWCREFDSLFSLETLIYLFMFICLKYFSDCKDMDQLFSSLFNHPLESMFRIFSISLEKSNAILMCVSYSLNEASNMLMHSCISTPLSLIFNIIFVFLTSDIYIKCILKFYQFGVGKKL